MWAARATLAELPSLEADPAEVDHRDALIYFCSHFQSRALELGGTPVPMLELEGGTRMPGVELERTAPACAVVHVVDVVLLEVAALELVACNWRAGGRRGPRCCCSWCTWSTPASSS